MYRAVLDTNILLSAFVFGGNPEELFGLARKRKFKLIISPSILFEFATILKNKFLWNDTDIADAIKTIGYCSELVKPTLNLKVLSDDADNRILECALEGHADYIVSGDHHLLELEEYENVHIVRAKKLVSLLGESN